MQENSPNSYKRTLFHAGYCRYSELLIVQMADFDLWLPARDAWLFSPAHNQCQIDRGAVVEFLNQFLMKSWEIQQPWGACVGVSIASVCFKNQQVANITQVLVRCRGNFSIPLWQRGRRQTSLTVMSSFIKPHVGDVNPKEKFTPFLPICLVSC